MGVILSATTAGGEGSIDFLLRFLDFTLGFSLGISVGRLSFFGVICAEITFVEEGSIDFLFRFLGFAVIVLGFANFN